MDQKVTRRALLGAGLALPLFAGCGSGSGGAGGANASRGTLKLTLNIPASRAAGKPIKTRAFGGSIPLGTNAVKIAVTNPTTGAAVATPQLIPGPFPTTSTNAPAVTISFTNIPVGNVSIQILAFPDTAGQQPALATGTATALIIAGSTTNITVPFVLTLNAFRIVQTSVNVGPQSTGQSPSATANAIVQDASARTLAYPIYWLSEDPGIAQVTFDVNNPTTATISYVSSGITNVTVVEPNSGMTATVKVFSDVE